MPKFVTIGYGDQTGYTATATHIRQAAHAHDAALQKQGVVMGIAGTPTQVRNPDATRVQTTRGAYMSSALPVAGFAIIDAPTIEAAIEMVAQTPCAVAQGVVEVWPLANPGDNES